MLPQLDITQTQLPPTAEGCASVDRTPLTNGAGTNPVGQRAGNMRQESSGLRSGRFVFIDALRGLAAVSVMIFHFYRGAGGREILDGIIPSFLDTILAHGGMGVECFFVISGFVISYSLKQARVNWGFFARFVLRRSVRLDPPYWMAIVLAVGLSWVYNLFPNHRPAPLPTWPQALAHLLYSQELLGYDHIVVVFWTLCLEIQFYVVFCLLLWPAQFVQCRLARHFGCAPSWAGNLIVFAPLSLVALCWPIGLLHDNLWPGLFLPTWHLFLLGVFAHWALESRWVGLWFMIILLGLTVAFFWTQPIDVPIGVTTAVVIWCVGKGNRLSDWLSYRWLQYLGGLSYSIYLLHVIIGGRVLNIGHRLTPNSVAGYLFWVGLAVVATLISAHLLYVYVERPCVRLAQRLKVFRPHVASELSTLTPQVQTS